MESLVGNTPSMNWDSHDLEGQWKSFKQHVEFMFKGPLKEKSEEAKCSYLMIWVGEKGRNIYSTWTLSADDAKLLKTYYEKFELYVKPRTNVIYNRYKFQSRSQSESELFEQFVTDLKLLVKDCTYDKPDEMVRDRIVIGIRNTKIREKLISAGGDLTLVKAEEIAKLHELSTAQAKSMSQEDSQVNAVKYSGGTTRKSAHANTGTNKQSNFGHAHASQGPKSRYDGKKKKLKDKQFDKCSRCGSRHGQNSACPANGQKCLKCGKLNHFKKMCRTKHVHTIDEDSDSSDEEQTLFLGCLDTNAVDNRWSQSILIDKHCIDFQLDTGAMCSVIPFNTLKHINMADQMLPYDSKPLRSYSGHKILPKGTVLLTCKIPNDTVTHDVNFHVVDIDSKPILGAEACERLSLVQRVHKPMSDQTNVDSVTDYHVDVDKDYRDVFNGLGALPGKHTIKVDTSVTPVVHAPRKVPFAIKNKLKAELDRMEQLGVIIKQEEPTPWVSSMVTVVKPNGKLRVCIDPKDLNKAIQREHYPLKTIEEVVAEIPEAKIFTKLDATSGFWQICLDEESTKLCTFNSPFGRYSFTRLPFGVKSASEVYQRKISEMVADLEGCQAIIDDILIWGKDMEEHDRRLKSVLDRVRQNNMKLSRDKCEFRKNRITYVGHVLTDKGLQPDDEKIRAVINMKVPTNKQELQTFMGFITYLGKFLPNLSEVSAPLRLLTEKDTLWHWEAEQEASFRKLKELVTKAPVLRYYDPKKPLTLTVDASSKGLGAALIQEGQPVAFASRALTKSQQNYAQIEKETLAISFGCARFHQYIFGKPVTVESDHKPLESIFRKSLYKAPPRLQSLLLSLQKYDLTVTFKPGKLMFIADTLSRAYLDETKEDLNPNLSINSILHLPVTEERYREIQLATSQDGELQILQEIVQSGWPNRKELVPDNIRHYWSCRDEISCIDGLLFKGLKLIVPTSLRKEMLNIIHSSHLGIVKCKSRAREVLYWPGMSSQIEDLIAKCEICAQHQRMNSKEPLLETETPSRPWSIVSTDLLEFKGSNYLVVVDHYSKWPELALLDNLSSSTTITHLKSLFARYGIPDKLISDNGPQYSSDAFKSFAKSYGFDHITTSPHFPQANGQAERTVQTVKSLLKKSEDPYLALLAYRNTTIDTIGMSPSQMFLGRRLKSDLPTPHHYFSLRTITLMISKCA